MLNGRTGYRQDRGEEAPDGCVCGVRAEGSPDHRACPTLRMLSRPSLAFRAQVWLSARVAMNCMHCYKQESNALLAGARISHCSDVIAVMKLWVPVCWELAHGGD